MKSVYEIEKYLEIYMQMKIKLIRNVVAIEFGYFKLTRWLFEWVNKDSETGFSLKLVCMLDAFVVFVDTASGSCQNKLILVPH